MAQASGFAYLRRWALVACAIVSSGAALNLVVDPYGIYHIVETEGLNSFKSRAAQRGRQFKLHLLERYRPAAVALGNSRAEAGFDPEHPAFARAAGPSLNLALPGTGIDTTIEFMQRAIAAGPPKIAVIGLDFLDARITGAAPRAAQPGGKKREVAAWWRRFADHVDTLASTDALYDSLMTVRDNRRKESPGLTPLGFNPMRDYESIARNEGYHQLFLQRDTENARMYARGPNAVFVDGSRTSPYFEAVRALIDSCRRAGIELHLVIYPYHAHILELFHAVALWESFEEWKRGLAAVLRDESAARMTGVRVRLWDFSGYTDFTTEQVPPAADRRTRMRWHWEAGHFKKELGDIMLERMLSGGGNAEGTGHAFGVVLEEGMLEQHLSRIRAARERYRQTRAEEILELEQIARSAARAQASKVPSGPLD